MLTIGRFALPLPVIQAAMSGYSDWPMRRMARQLGAPYSICEVMTESFVNSLRDRPKTRHYLYLGDDDHPTGAQLMGSRPEEFPPAARRLVDAGFDVIDINFGCPAKRISGRCRGGYHLGQPETAIEILQRVRDAIPVDIPMTVKMRRGLNDSQQSCDAFFQILDAAFEIGAAAVTIHGRTVEQKYVGPSRWSFLSEVRRMYPARVLLGSGDLFTAEDCVRMLKETGVNGVTAARGSIGNPWIFSQAAALLQGNPLPAPPTVHEQRDVICNHLQLAEQVLPAELAVRQLRKFGIYYAAWHPDFQRVRDAFVAANSRAAWQQVIAEHYSRNQPGCFPVNPGNSKHSS